MLIHVKQRSPSGTVLPKSVSQSIATDDKQMTLACQQRRRACNIDAPQLKIGQGGSNAAVGELQNRPSLATKHTFGQLNTMTMETGQSFSQPLYNSPCDKQMLTQ